MGIFKVKPRIPKPWLEIKISPKDKVIVLRSIKEILLKQIELLDMKMKQMKRQWK